ncbi:PIH1 domain-containing protein 1 [Anopheles ziemanni]|uniref:PIH1 domain-containing protein 1 n=1 Tax=Anopheles coustani TaxID=139045 RepID=UPI00265B5C62|nr:PIH1 domain-containing protein 1 [Anopheles coustani]XP_058177173.1 PIH1 domain-containing protein 1 [Anopheles ziemanni]
MNRPSNTPFLDGSELERSLRIVQNDEEEQLENFFAPVAELADDISSGRSKIVKPLPGFCIKAFKQGTEEKFFINVCHTDGIPPPRDITEDELIRILNDGEMSNFRVPLSITHPRETLDKSSQGCQVCDIAINSKFFREIEAGGLKYEFLVTVIFDGIEHKYGVTLDERNFRKLKNKKFIDKLIPHNIQNRDVKQVIESYHRLDHPEPPLSRSAKPVKKPLIEEIDAGTMKSAKNETNSTRSSVVSGAPPSSVAEVPYVPDPTKVAISQATSRKPESKLFREPPAGKAQRLIGEFHLPECNSSSEITLDVGEDRIFLEARKKGYLLDVFVDYRIDDAQVEAHFDTTTKILQVTMPLVGASEKRPLLNQPAGQPICT